MDGLVFVGDELHQVNGRKVHDLTAVEVCLYPTSFMWVKLKV